MNENNNQKSNRPNNSGAQNTSFVKSICDASKISKSVKKNVKSDSLSNFSQDNSIRKKIAKGELFKDISEIKPQENFICTKEIKNSIFMEGNENEKENSKLNVTQLHSGLSEKSLQSDLSEVIFNKIINAEPGETIHIPDKTIKLRYLIISKPIKLKGKAGSVLEITEGPIIINIEDKYENEFVIFSELVINFDLTGLPQGSPKRAESSKQVKNSYLFKLFPGSLLEMEDCDISCNGDKRTKIICFQVNSKISFKNPQNEAILFEKNDFKNSSILSKAPSQNGFNKGELNLNISILTLRSTKITNFYQSIRAGENVVLNIEKCFINNNLGKAIVVLNPIIAKITESTFESNMENAIHIKFLKDDFINFDTRKLYFEKNDIIYNFGYGIYIDGIENFFFDINITVLNNNFKKNRFDGLFLSDLIVNSLTIEGNNFKENKSNGLNLQKLNRCGSNSMNSHLVQGQNINGNCNVSQGASNNSHNNSNITKDSPTILVKNNHFADSEGFGVFINDSRAIFLHNEFLRNKASGIILCNINFYELYKETKSTNINNSTSLDQGTSFIQYCNFVKNGGSGVKVFNYSFNTAIVNSKMIENCEFGLQVEQEVSTDSASTNPTTQKSGVKQSNSKSQDNQGSNLLQENSQVFLKNCQITSNMKSGVSLSNSFLAIEHTEVANNLDYAIYVPKEEFQQLIQFKDSNSEGCRMIHGTIGGPWGEVNITRKKSCTGCMSTSSAKKVKRAKLVPVEESPRKANSDIGESIVNRKNLADKNSEKSENNNSESKCVTF